MASRRQRKNRAKRQPDAANRSAGSGELHEARPTPVRAIALRHSELADRLGLRPDQFSQLLAKIFNDQHVGQQLLTANGLTPDEQEELASLRDEAHAAFRKELDTASETLRGLLRSGDPLYILSWIQTTTLMSPWGEYYEPTAERGENRVELVAGLLASQPASEKVEPPTSDEMQQVNDEIEHILDLLYLFNLSIPRSDDTHEDAIRFLGVMRWMTMRGSSFAGHGRDLARAVFAPYDRWFLQTYGFTVDDAIAIGEAVERRLNSSLNALLGNAAKFANDVLGHLENPDYVSALSAEARTRVATVEGRQELASHALIDVINEGMRNAATFTSDELCADVPQLDPARVESALEELSLVIGSRDTSSYTGLFDPNPLVERPFLKHADLYMLPVPGMLLRETLKVFDGRLIRGTSGYSKSRSMTLDRLAVDLLASVLPGASCYTNLYYDGGELDGLVLFEDIAFVVEGKGSPISFQAQRGDVARLVNEIRASVEDALRQATRARDYILDHDEALFVDEHGVELLRLSQDKVRRVHIVNPTLHELGGLAQQLSLLRPLGLFSDGDLPWSIYINDLRVIAETTENPAVFLHYLTWRSRLALGREVIVHDEIDLWGAYLLGARFPPLAPGGIHNLGNSTTDFDDYYAGLEDMGPRRRKPRKWLQEPVRSFVDRMAGERPSGWLEAAGVCLDLSIPELAFVHVNARKLVVAATQEGAPIEMDFGRGILIGVPRGTRTSKVLAHARRTRRDASFYVYVRETGTGRAAVIWAAYGESISLELSELEKLILAVPDEAAADTTANASTRPE